MLKTFAEQADEASRLMGQPWPDCGSCLYWKAYDEQERTGECRRRTPHAEYGWPTTTPKEWCAEWAQLK